MTIAWCERAYEKSEQCEEKSETLDEIIERVGKEYGLTESEMVAGGRQRHPAEARGMIGAIFGMLGGYLMGIAATLAIGGLILYCFFWLAWHIVKFLWNLG